MLYDQLLGLCERHAQDLLPIIAHARVFEFPHVPHEVLAKHHSAKSRDFFNEYFALPFPLVAVEDQASCVVMWDSAHESVGLNVRRQYIECVKFDAKHLSAFKEHGLPGQEMSKREMATLQDVYAITSGILNSIKAVETDTGSSGYEAQAQLLNVLIVSKKRGVLMHLSQFPKQAQEMMAKSAARNAITAIEEFMAFNGPDRFVVEVAPTNSKGDAKKKALRSADKPKYILLTPTEIREKLGTAAPDEEAIKTAPHERRRHVRLYPNDPERWPNMHGKAKVIQACWVGPTEAVIGKRNYRVCLEM